MLCGYSANAYNNRLLGFRDTVRNLFMNLCNYIVLSDFCQPSPRNLLAQPIASHHLLYPLLKDVGEGEGKVASAAFKDLVKGAVNTFLNKDEFESAASVLKPEALKARFNMDQSHIMASLQCFHLQEVLKKGVRKNHDSVSKCASVWVNTINAIGLENITDMEFRTCLAKLTMVIDFDSRPPLEIAEAWSTSLPTMQAIIG